MNSEKVKEIKKGLECCSTLMDNNATSEEQDNSCNDCPYRQNDRCSWNLDKDALSLINELESENKRQKQACKKVIDIIFSNNEENKQLKDRLDELEKENEILQGTKDRLTFADRIKLVNNAREKALKQFAERLKKKIITDYINGTREYAIAEIDETLKELKGE